MMSRWITNSAIILLPATGLMAFQAWQVNESRQMALVISQAQSAVEPEPAEVKQTMPELIMPAEVEHLPYPEFGPLRALPKPVEIAIQTNEAELPAQAGIPADPDSEALLDDLDLTALSPELSQLVQKALVADSKQDHAAADPARSEPVDKLTEKAVQYRGVLPPLDLQMHMYTTDSHRRWVKINGLELSEGEWLTGDIQLVQIAQRYIIIRFNGRLIEIPQMYEWLG